MSRYGIDLIKYGWHMSDCPLRRMALKVGRWAGLGLGAVVVLGIAANAVFIRIMGNYPGT